MRLKIPYGNCERLPNSVYNRNYYKLPFEVDGYNTVYCKSDDDMTTEFWLVKGDYSFDSSDCIPIGSTTDLNHIVLDSEEKGKLYT